MPRTLAGRLGELAAAAAPWWKGQHSDFFHGHFSFPDLSIFSFFFKTDMHCALQ